MVTIKDISREAGVSTAVVSVVLNNATTGRIKASPALADRIRKIAKRMNYHPNLIARQLTGKKSGIIGVVMDSCAPQSYYKRLSQMEIYASSRGYRFMIGQAHNNIEKIKEYAQFFANYGVDGIICMAHEYPKVKNRKSDGIADFFLSRRKTVFFLKPAGIPDCCSVTIDLAYNFREAVKYLASQGRKKIGFFKLSDFHAGPTMAIAQQGYCKGLEEAGLPFAPKLVKGIPIEQKAHPEKVREKVNELVRAGANAIVAVDDFVAAAVLKSLQLSGIKVPDAIAIIGCDNLEIAALLNPGLTTFEQHNEQVAVKLVDLVIDLIEERPIPPEDRNIIIQPTMIKRESA